MDTRTPRILLMANTAVFLLVCAAFSLHNLGLAPFSEDVRSWLDDNQWLMWTAMAIAVASALALPLLSPRLRQPGDDR
ncbi:hypothetical protein AB0I81_24795 [Nonomuraea sp. NPDC050404]|uniref:hypothetical protein n=1 Tax=Nonomuraea sp. NPDC050404 TaxID=3155783 RepID=UPI0033F1C9BA